jgi:hypothetical protein
MAGVEVSIARGTHVVSPLDHLPALIAERRTFIRISGVGDPQTSHQILHSSASVALSIQRVVRLVIHHISLSPSGRADRHLWAGPDDQDVAVIESDAHTSEAVGSN